MGTCEGRLGCVWLALYAPKWQQLSCILPRELRWFQEWFMSPMSRGDNDKSLEHQFGGHVRIQSSRHYYNYHIPDPAGRFGRRSWSYYMSDILLSSWIASGRRDTSGRWWRDDHISYTPCQTSLLSETNIQTNLLQQSFWYLAQNTMYNWFPWQGNSCSLQLDPTRFVVCWSMVEHG